MPEAGQRLWSARSLGSAFQHRVFYALIRLGGRRAAYGLLYPVAAWYALFRPAVRKRAAPYLRRRFPGRGPAGRLLDFFRLCLALGRVLVDRAVLGILGPGSLEWRLEGREELQALLGEGRGLILLMAHAGSWQVAMGGLARLGPPASVLIHREEGDVDRHFFEHGKGPAPLSLIDPAGHLGGILEMLRVLEKGELLCIMGDRLMGGSRSSVPVTFLGGEIPVPFSPYRLASATGAPIAVLFPYRSEHDSYGVRLARVIRVPGDLGRDPAAYRLYAQQFIRALEAFVREQPYQFFNFFDMWSPIHGDPSSPEADPRGRTEAPGPGGPGLR